MSATKRQKLDSGATHPVLASLAAVKSSKDQLYDACLRKKPEAGAEFTIKEILDYGVTDDETELARLCQHLLDCYLFAPYKRPNGVAVYRLRSRQDASKISQLSGDTVMVFQQIEIAGQTGIWKKTLQGRTNLHENTVTKSLKDLLAKALIKEFRTSKNTAKRMYILHSLSPSEESTGGNFYKEGELDEGLVNTLNEFIVEWIQRKSWVERRDARRPSKGKDSTLARLKKTSTGEQLAYRPSFSREGYPLVPQPAGYDDYPTPEDVLQVIEELDFLKDITLSLADISQLIQQLIYDDKLEEMSPGKYRSVRNVWQKPAASSEKPGASSDTPAIRLVGAAEPDEHGYAPGNGLTQSPCGRCPVASDCRLGGLIGPETCVYMKEWLDQLF